jgi:hypothetical protein
MANRYHYCYYLVPQSIGHLNLLGQIISVVFRHDIVLLLIVVVAAAAAVVV